MQSGCSPLHQCLQRRGKGLAVGCRLLPSESYGEREDEAVIGPSRPLNLVLSPLL